MTDRHYAGLDKIIELVLLFNDDMTQSLARDGLTVSRAHILWELRERGPVPQRELAEALKVSARTITGLVDGLVSTGFVTREPHPTDRRAALITFTAQGEATVKEMTRGHQQLAELLFGDMPADRFDCFVDGLDGILVKLREAIQ